MTRFTIVADLYLGSLGWVDIRADVRQSSARSGGGISITRGRANEGQRVDPGRASLTINNRGGQYSPRNPSSDYYGLIGRNTPIRIGVELATDAFGRTASSGWGAADTGQAWTATGGSVSDFSVSSGGGRHSHGTINVYRRTTLAVDLVDTEQLVDASTPVLITGAALVTGVLARYQDSSNYYWLRTEFNAGGTSVMLKITKIVAGVETQLAVLNPVPGLAYAAGVPLRTRASVVGGHLAIKVWTASDPEPLDWTLETTDTDLIAAGATGLQTWVVSGNTNTSPRIAVFDNYELVDRRCYHEVSSWPSRWDLSENDVWVPVEAAGILRRLGQGARPLRSPLHRTLAVSSPIAWWTLEDGVDSTQAASGLPGGTPLTVSAGVMDFIADGPTGAAGAAQPEVSATNSLAGPVAGGSSTAWQMSVWTRGLLADGWVNAYYVPLEVRTTAGQILRFVMQTDGLGKAAVARYDSEADTAEDDLLLLTNAANGNAESIDGAWHLLQATFTQSGADTIGAFYYDGQLAETGTWTGVTIGAPTRVSAIGRFGGDGPISNDMAETQISHAAIHNTDALVAQYQAGLAHVGETAAERITRLCTEEGISLALVEGPDESVALGPQRVDTFVDLLAEAADADMGILHEQRAGLGLIYRTHTTLENQTAVELDYAAGHISPPFEPVDDDDAVRNDVEAKRPDGSSARSVQETGPLSILAPPDGVGTYDESVTVNVEADTQLPDQAGWRRHLGTWDESRYPRITLNLAGTVWQSDPDLTGLAVAVDSGSRVTVDGLPAWMPPGPADVLVQGYTERLDAFERVITWNATPAGPYDIATADGEQRVAADGSTLGGTLALGGMSLSLTSTASNGVWTTTAANFPLDVRVGGEQVTLSAITGSTSPQTATITARGVNGITRAWAAGTEVDVWNPAIAPL